MASPLLLRPYDIASAIRDQLEKPMATPHRQPEPPQSWPLYEVPRRDAASPFGVESNDVIDDMVSVLSVHRFGSTAEALAFLRQVYPRYPLTLRLAALVAYSKSAGGFGDGSGE